MLSPVKEQVSQLNQYAQERLRSADRLSDRGVVVGQIWIHEGERVILNKTSPTYGLAKGTVGTVTRLEPISKTAVLQLDNGSSRLINLRLYRDLSLAYALTPMAARAVEAKQVYVLTQGMGRDLGMIQVSRGKVSTRIYAAVSKQEAERVNPTWKIGAQIAFEKEYDLAITLQRQQTNSQRHLQ
jgi:hypothetical protein